MKDYYHFTANDFVMDEYFRNWVWKPTDESNLYWRSWIARHPDKVTEVEEAINLLKRLPFAEYKLGEDEVQAIWQNIKGAPQAGDGLPGKAPANRWWISIAASIVFITVTTLFFWDNDKTIRIETAYGETRTLLLPDSSTVILNANSRIEYSNNWGSQSIRQVWLEGEAFFEVIHTVNHQPFHVKISDGVAVEVLGTSFNVYHRKADTKVVLNTGKITLSIPSENTEKKIVMKPGELVEFKKDKISKREVDPVIYAAWTENKIILNQTSLQEMIGMAKDNYGIEIEVTAEKMLTQTVSGSMPTGDAESFPRQIAQAFHLKLTRNNNKIILSDE